MMRVNSGGERKKKKRRGVFGNCIAIAALGFSMDKRL